jgi:hypothetical protein
MHARHGADRIADDNGFDGAQRPRASALADLGRKRGFTERQD